MRRLTLPAAAGLALLAGCSAFKPGVEVTQLERNLALAQQGMEAGSLRVMAVSEHLESVAGDLQELQVQLRQPELPAPPAWSVDHPDSEGDPGLDPLTADLHAELDELDHLLREALGA